MPRLPALAALSAALIVGLALASAEAQEAPAAAAPATTALHCGRVFDARAARMVGEHTLVMADGRISAVRAGAPTAADGPVIDASDATCTPGWIDMHVHLGSQSSPASYAEGFRLDPEDYAFRAVGYARRTLDAGFTTVRDLGGEVTLSLRDAINQGLVPGPRIYAAGKSIATTGGHADPTNGLNHQLSHLIGPPGPTGGVVNSPDEARQAVRQRYQDGSDVIKITATGGVLSYARSADAPQFTEDEVAAVVATARDYGYRVAAHAHGEEGMRRAVAAGVDSIEHGTYMSDEVARMMRERGTWYVPTISAGRFVAEKAEIDGYFPEIVRPKAREVGALIQATFARAHRLGVPIAFGTDMGVGPHGENAREFLYMAEAGMAPLDTLQTATWNAARLLGEEDELGLIAEGFHADVVVLDGDPAADLATVLRPRMVLKAGEVAFRRGE